MNCLINNTCSQGFAYINYLHLIIQTYASVLTIILSYL